MILTSLDIDPELFKQRTGWEIKPEGACKGDVCVPLPPDARTGDGRVSAPVLSEHLGLPFVADEDHLVWCLGPESGETRRATLTAKAPELELPDLEGRPFRLSSLRGLKVLLVAWASW